MSILPDPTLTNQKAKEIYQKIDHLRGGHHYPGLYVALSNYPELAEVVSNFGQFLRFKGKLPADVREVAILTTASSLRIAYIWITHQPNALEAGLTPELIQRILKNDLLEDYPHYAQVQELVRVFLSLEKVPQELQDGLVKELGMEAFLQLSVIVNFYRMIAGLTIGFEFSIPKEDSSIFSE